MSCFSTVSSVAANSESDLTKHVNYTAGMILGVDDFTQEFAYLAGRDRWLTRDALGYGTLSGLSIQIEKDADKNDIRVLVNAGVAVSPRGQFICVPTPQCAYLNEWLAAAKPEDLNTYVRHASPPVSSPPVSDELTLYVVLCYRDCPTDKVPIPGEPCRQEDELTAASRLKDDFSLELRFEAPRHAEEKSVRRFVEWLKQISVTDSGTSTPLADFLEAIRAEFMPASPPVVLSPAPALEINAADFCDYMRAAFRLWVTELRAVLSERETGCCGEMTAGKKLEDCVLLAELRIPLTSASPNRRVSETEDVEKIEENRPFLLHLRMLQEWMLCGCHCTNEASAPVVSPLIPFSPPVASPVLTSPFLSPSITSPEITSPLLPEPSPPITSPFAAPPHEHTLDSLSDVTVGSPSDKQVLLFQGDQWIAGTLEHGALSELELDQHPQYFLADGSRVLGGTLDGGAHLITNIAPAEADNQAVVFQQAIKDGDDAGGDLSEKYPAPKVIKLQGRQVTEKEPSENDILVWNGTEWSLEQKPVIPPPTASKQDLILPLATITKQDLPRLIVYELWFNIDAPGNLVEIEGDKLAGISVFEEVKKTPTLPTGQRETFLVPIKTGAATLSPNLRNVFLIALTEEKTYMRFRFDLSKIKVSVDGAPSITLDKYADENSINFYGYMKEKRGFVTLFVRGTPKLG